MAAFAMSKPHGWMPWLLHAARRREVSRENGIDTRLFVALQLDARGVEPFTPLLDMLAELGGEHWTYRLDDGRTEVTMTNRWRHITVGQNLVFDYCQADLAVACLLFLAADTETPVDIIPRMWEMNHPLVAPYISTYGLRGEPVERFPFPVEAAMASAACVFVRREVFRSIRWRWDAESQMSDDPCLHHDALTLLGIPTYVRHDIQAWHHPRAVGAYDTRFAPEDLKVAR
jgi:hypothetical protein